MSGTVPEGARVFDRRRVRLNRARAAAGFSGAAFLLREVADRLADRLDDIKRRFPLALDLGCHRGELGQVLAGRGGVERLIQADLAPEMAAYAGAGAIASSARRTTACEPIRSPAAARRSHTVRTMLRKNFMDSRVQAVGFSSRWT